MRANRKQRDRAVRERKLGFCRPTSLTAVLILIVAALVPSATIISGEPTLLPSADNTRSFAWTFDSPENFTTDGAVVGGGLGTLEYITANVTETTRASFQQGTTLENLSADTRLGSLVLDGRSAEVHNMTIWLGLGDRDTFIASADPTANFGDNYSLMLDGQSGNEIRPLIELNLNPIPSQAVIVEASLWLYLVNGLGDPLQAYLLALNSSWGESTATWLEATSGRPWYSPGGDFVPLMIGVTWFSNTMGWYGTDVAKLIDLWKDSELPNNGLMLVAEPTTTDSLKIFASSDQTARPDLRPRLEVKYTLPGLKGQYESSVLGPGTNSTFTTASWSNSSVSFAIDEFSGTTLSPRWSWYVDPSSGNGSYDVGATRPGWLHIEGDGSPWNWSSYSGINILAQNITDDFSATTHVENPSANDNTGTGILVYADPLTYVGIYLSGKASTSLIVVVACEGGVSRILALFPWTGFTHAYLGVEKRVDSVMVHAGTDGTNWLVSYAYTPPMHFMDRVLVGPYVSSDDPAVSATADVEYFRILPLGLPMTTEVSVRVGNSTSLLDPSWSPWSPWLPSYRASKVNMSGKYMQYRVSFYSKCDWYSPSFDEFTCDYGHYAPNGTIETENYAPPGLKAWSTFTTAQNDGAGPVLFSYSTDDGGNWTERLPGGSYAMSPGGDSIQVRIYLQTNDTLKTPSVDKIAVTYDAAIYSFYVRSANSTVVAGDGFSLTVTIKDESNVTVTSWEGPILLEAMDPTGTTFAHGTLQKQSARISDGGQITITDERYFVAEVIRIRASSGQVIGMSAPISIVPGPVASVVIAPNVTHVLEYSSNEFTASAYDAYDNFVPSANYSWMAEHAIGNLSTTVGRYVILSTDGAGVQGNLTASSDGVSSTLLIQVVAHIYPPDIVGQIPAQVRDEDSGSWSLDISSYVSDVEDPDALLRWYVVNETIVEISAGENATGNLVITFNTLQDMFGWNNLTLVVVDSQGMSNSTVIPVVLNGVNDRPTIDHIEPIVVKHGEGYTYDFVYYVHDVDNSFNELQLAIDEANAPYSAVSGLRVTFTYPSSLNGTDRFVVIAVSDGDLSSSTVLRVTVLDNEVPVTVGHLPNLSLNQGATKVDFADLDSFFADPDDDVLMFFIVSTHVIATTAPDNTVDITAPTDWYGLEYVVFRATDPHGARIESAIQVTVLKVNQPPTISNVPDLKVRYDLRYDFDLLPYIDDPDNEPEGLIVTTDDPRISVVGTMLSLSYPRSMNNTVTQVRLTVSDGVAYASCTITVSVSSNYPPVLAMAIPGHEFLEDVPVPYPVVGYLEYMFTDAENTSALAFEAFSWADEVNATAVNDSSDHWSVWFESKDDYYGSSKVTLRAVDADGALVEATIQLSVLGVPDRPVLDLPLDLFVTQGVQMALDMSLYVTDADPLDTEFRFELAGDVAPQMEIQGSVLVGNFPKNYLESHEDTRTVNVEVRTIDPEGLVAEDTIAIHVTRAPAGKGLTTVVYAAMAGMAGTVGLLTVYAYRTRKRPFVVQDMMLIHNDGLLIGRYALDKDSTVDEQIMSGMLTAVLNFVEDSMTGSGDKLKTFGFEGYMVLVQRGKRVYAALAHDGDAPETIGEDLGQFLGQIEQVYKQGVESWSGDLEKDFPAVDMLITSWVHEHSKKAKPKSHPRKLQQPKEAEAKPPEKPEDKPEDKQAQ